MNAAARPLPLTTDPLTAATDWLEHRHMEMRQRRQEAALRDLERDLGPAFNENWLRIVGDEPEWSL